MHTYGYDHTMKLRFEEFATKVAKRSGEGGREGSGGRETGNNYGNGGRHGKGAERAAPPSLAAAAIVTSAASIPPSLITLSSPSLPPARPRANEHNCTAGSVAAMACLRCG